MFFICGAIYYAVLGDLNFKKQKKNLFCHHTLLYTVESRFFELPRETEIGSKNQDFKKSKVA